MDRPPAGVVDGAPWSSGVGNPPNERSRTRLSIDIPLRFSYTYFEQQQTLIKGGKTGSIAETREHPESLEKFLLPVSPVFILR